MKLRTLINKLETLSQNGQNDNFDVVVWSYNKDKTIHEQEPDLGIDLDKQKVHIHNFYKYE